MEKLCLESMSDDRLLERMEVLVGRSNAITSELLAYLGEVDVRRLHLGLACSSLFVFCVERLHMSESAAGKRITAARLARRFPVVLKMIAQGEIHLTAVTMLAAHLTEGNHGEVLAPHRLCTRRSVLRSCRSRLCTRRSVLRRGGRRWSRRCRPAGTRSG